MRADPAKTERRHARTIAAAILIALGLAGCGERSSLAAGSRPTISPLASTTTATGSQPAPESTTDTAPSGPAPATSNHATPVPPPMGGTTSSPTPLPTPTPFAFPANFAAASATDSAAISRSYQDFLADVAGLDAGFDPGWVTRMRQVATAKLIDAVQQVAAGFQKLGDHTEGALHDSHVGIQTRGSRAVVIDCLDEYDWYLVNDKSGEPDPGATRGNFEAFSSFVHTSTGWKISLWKPGSYACQY